MITGMHVSPACQVQKIAGKEYLHQETAAKQVISFIKYS